MSVLMFMFAIFMCRPAIPEVLLGRGGSVEVLTVVEKTELFQIGCK